ncbi:MAG: hypothetical protein IT256_07700 [Chitinophagaceae bacterium]|nr:hypothetical protein [Chitinophagaceae bacterium]
MDFLKIIQETESEFAKIADELFHNFAIQTHNSLYRISEIEFYWNSPNHTDNSTYKRNHVSPNLGDWFFHYSGVDIALKDERTGGYGGILIRSIYEVNNNELTKGPMVCAMKLFSGTTAFEQSIQTRIVPYSFDKIEIKNTTRVGLGKNAQENGADKFNYAYLIHPKK